MALGLVEDVKTTLDSDEHESELETGYVPISVRY